MITVTESSLIWAFMLALIAGCLLGYIAASVIFAVRADRRERQADEVAARNREAATAWGIRLTGVPPGCTVSGATIPADAEPDPDPDNDPAGPPDDADGDPGPIYDMDNPAFYWPENQHALRAAAQSSQYGLHAEAERRFIPAGDSAQARFRAAADADAWLVDCYLSRQGAYHGAGLPVYDGFDWDRLEEQGLASRELAYR
jgi:hypothetical protein